MRAPGAWPVWVALIAALALAGRGVAEEQDAFTWSWEDVETIEPEKGVAPGQRPDADAYNRLLAENLDLRRRLQESDRGAESIRRENARLRAEMADLEARITESALTISEMKAAGRAPDAAAAERLAAAERERAALAAELEALRQRLERSEDRSAAAGIEVKPGSDLFVALERENAELRARFTALEREKVRTEKALRDVEEQVAGFGDTEEGIAKHREVIRLLLDRIPALEADLADARTAVENRDDQIERRDRELRAVMAELDRREARLRKAERIVALLARARDDVQQVGDGQKRDMHYNMAVVFANRGQFREAEREYLRALRLDPMDADAHFNLGLLYDDELNEPRKAAGHYRRYINLRPDAPDVNEVRLWIAELEAKY